MLWAIDVYLNYKTTKARIMETKKDINRRIKKKTKRKVAKKS
jgi:hypothetical protein